MDTHNPRHRFLKIGYTYSGYGIGDGGAGVGVGGACPQHGRQRVSELRTEGVVDEEVDGAVDGGGGVFCGYGGDKQVSARKDRRESSELNNSNVKLSLIHNIHTTPHTLMNTHTHTYACIPMQYIHHNTHTHMPTHLHTQHHTAQTEFISTIITFHRKVENAPSTWVNDRKFPVDMLAVIRLAKSTVWHAEGVSKLRCVRLAVSKLTCSLYAR